MGDQWASQCVGCDLVFDELWFPWWETVDLTLFMLYQFGELWTLGWGTIGRSCYLIKIVVYHVQTAPPSLAQNGELTAFPIKVFSSLPYLRNLTLTYYVL
jgi:hypothetical protein